MLATSRFRLNEPQVIGEVLDGELVLVNFTSGCYFSLRETGADICNLLRAGRTVGQVGAQLAEHYQVPEGEVASALYPFVARLVDEQLLIASDAEPAGESNVGPVAATYSPPVLEKFEDMADQLLLDPIHEIDRSGWPIRASA